MHKFWKKAKLFVLFAFFVTYNNSVAACKQETLPMSVSRIFDKFIITGACIPHKKTHYELFFCRIFGSLDGVFASNNPFWQYCLQLCKNNKTLTNCNSTACLTVVFWYQTSSAQAKTGGKFKYFVKKNCAENFSRALEAVESIREVRSLPKVADCSQDYSDISGFSERESLDVSPQFPWKIQLPA